MIDAQAEEPMTQTAEYCQSCGVAIKEPSAFCGSCGAALTEPSPPDPPAPSSRAANPSSTGSPPARPATAATGAAGVPQGAGPAAQTVPPASAPAPGGFSPTGGQPTTGSRSWIPFAAVGGAAALAAAVVAILLLALGGSAGKNLKSTAVTRQQALQLLADSGTTTVSSAAPGLFALVSTGKLTAIVPAGWRATAQAASGTTRAEFTDPKHAGSSLTIVAQGTASGNAHNQAGAALKAVKGTGDTVSAYGPVTFPGGREAWQVTYTHAGLTDETYFFSACSGKAAMVVAVETSSAIFQREQTTLGAVAASAEPVCS
jgi:hypothetical protein